MSSPSSASSSSSTTTTTKRIRKDWTDEETFTMIEGWNHVDAELNKMGPRKPIYTKIIVHLQSSGFTRSIEQVKKKISDLRNQYKVEKPKITGSSPAKWKYFNEVHKILNQSHYFNLDNSNVREVGLDPLDETSQSSESNDSPSGHENDNGENGNSDNGTNENGNHANGNDENGNNANGNPADRVDDENNQSQSNNNNSSSFVNDDRPISQSSRLAKKRKSKTQETGKVQDEILKMLKMGQDDDKELLEVIKESQKATTNSLSQIATSLSALTQAFQAQAQNPYGPSFFGNPGQVFYPGPLPPCASPVQPTSSTSGSGSSSTTSNYYNM